MNNGIETVNILAKALCKASALDIVRMALDIFRLKGELKLADHKGLRWVFQE